MSTAPGPLRIASYNLRDFRDDRAAAVRVVRTIAPDVLCLQEVPRRLLAAGRVGRFAAECGMRWPAHHRGSGGTSVFVSDRVVVDSVVHRRLSVAAPMRTRGYAVARLVPASGHPLVVASIHLSLLAGERHAHTRAILDRVIEMAGPGGRVVVAGDLNELATGLAWRLLGSRLALVSPPDPTFPAARPRTLLDVIFASPQLPVLPHPALDPDPQDLRAASDHLPVWVDLLA